MKWTIADSLRLYGKAARKLSPRAVVQWRNARTEDAVISTRMSTFPLFLRGGTSDREVFYQIFVDHEYRCIDHLKDVRTIIDAGANVGYSSAYLLTKFPKARVIALEPDPENFLILKRNVAPFGSRIICLQKALWSESATLNFRSETLAKGAEWGRQVEAGDGDVEATDIPALLELYRIEEVGLLKVDIEGAETEVFRNPVWLRRIRNIVIELHGPEEEKVFHSGIAGHRYSVSQCEELTVAIGAGASC